MEPESHYVERLALTLRESGVQPMAARVFAFALTADAERHTAGEFATALAVSPAAISGAVRYLVQVGMLRRVREPGTRSDLYSLASDDVWSRIFLDRLGVVSVYERVMRDGVEVIGPERPGGRRLAESADLFAFLAAELPALIERWNIERGKRRPNGPTSA